MAQTFLNLAQGVSGTLSTSNYVQGGIDVADQWYLNAQTTAGTNGIVGDSSELNGLVVI